MFANGWLLQITQTSHNQTRITGSKNKRPAHRLSDYGVIGIESIFSILQPAERLLSQSSTHTVCRAQVTWFSIPIAIGNSQTGFFFFPEANRKENYIRKRDYCTILTFHPHPASPIKGLSLAHT